MQVKIKYWLFSFLILFTAINMAVAEPCITHPATAAKSGQASKHAKLQKPAAAAESLTDQELSLTDLFIPNTQVLQTGNNLFGKRVQTDKDLLLLHAVKYSDAVKTASCNQVKFTDSLTHIFLFLFPHHFFW